MHLSIALKNLKKRKLRSLSLVLAVSISIITMNLFLSLDKGMQNYLFGTESIINDKFEIRPKGSTGSLLSVFSGSAQRMIQEDQIEKIKLFPEVKSLHSESSVKGLSSIQITILGKTLQSDAMIFGLPSEAFPDLQMEETWNEISEDNEPYPVILSTQLIDLYNFSFGGINNFPKFSTKDIIGKEITILFNQSTFFNFVSGKPIKKKGRIIGFSDNAKLIGVTIPQQIVQKINESEKIEFLGATVQLKKSSDLESISAKLDEMQLELYSPAQRAQKYASFLGVLNLSLQLIVIIITLITSLFIINAYLSNMRERIKEIGILRAIGANKNDIQKIFLFEASLIAFLSWVIAIFLSLIISIMLNGYYKHSLAFITTKPDTLFIYDWKIILIGMVASQILCISCALPAAREAAKIETLKALSNE